MQAVLYDFFGVVAKPHTISTTLAAILRKDLNTVKPVYETYEKGALTREAFWDRLGIKNYKEIERKLFESFRLDPDFRSVHETIKNRYATAVVSNADGLLIRTLLKSFGLENAFEAVVVSGEVRASKPEPKIYRLALAALDVNPKECVFVDDRLPNLKAAHDLGMTTIHHKLEPHRDSYEPDYTIDVLPQLLPILEELG